VLFFNCSVIVKIAKFRFLVCKLNLKIFFQISAELCLTNKNTKKEKLRLTRMDGDLITKNGKRSRPPFCAASQQRLFFWNLTPPQKKPCSYVGFRQIQRWRWNALQNLRKGITHCAFSRGQKILLPITRQNQHCQHCDITLEIFVRFSKHMESVQVYRHFWPILPMLMTFLSFENDKYTTTKQQMLVGNKHHKCFN